MFSKTIMAGCVLWGAFFAVLFGLRPASRLHVRQEKFGRAERVLSLAAVLLTAALCILPMGLSPAWNGEAAPYLRQYGQLAEAILDGHFYLDDGDIDPRLLAMDNPYDFEARRAMDISYPWDHAFYKGHFYMYFGVVPVFLLFLPFRLIFGVNLAEYQATQIFTAAFICGLFAAFALLYKRVFRQMTFGMYLTLSAAFAVMSVWYGTGAPALYCTAITAGLCMEVWSLFFFVRAVWAEEGESERKRTVYAFLGSLFGALAFGCRPPIALANLWVLPMAREYLRGRKYERNLIRRMLVAASPYLAVGILLMLYNYARFENPFEFGQSYQLTITDQSRYGSLFSQLAETPLLQKLAAYFFAYSPLNQAFPWLSYQGIFLNFPILLSGCAGLLKRVRNRIKERHFGGMLCVMALTVILIAVSDVLWAPTVRERYRMDVYWLMGILCFMVIGFCASAMPVRRMRVFSSLICICAFLTVCKGIWLYLIPFENNFTGYSLKTLEKIRQIIMLRQGVGLI